MHNDEIIAKPALQAGGLRFEPAYLHQASL